MRFVSWRPGQAASRRICEGRVRSDGPESSEPRRPAQLEHHISTGLRRLSVLCGTDLRRTGAALALGLFAATGFAAGAEAQSVLVSNTGRPDYNQNVKLDSFDITQSFTTGADSNGYTLSSVVIDFKKLGDRDVIASKLTASINANNSGVPGTSLGTLIASKSSRNVLTFSAGSSGISLEANTTYFFTIDVTEALNKNNRLPIAAGNAVDAGGAAGWSLGSRRTRDRTVSGAWSSSSSTELSFPFKITINGEVNTPGVTVTPAALEVTEGATATYDVVLDTAPTGNVVITPTSSATAKATVSTATLTFTSSNWNQAQQVTVNGVAAGSANISHVVTTSADTTNYPTSISIDPVAVTVTGLPVISITGGSAVTEGTGAEFTVTASPTPSADLTVRFIVADDDTSDFVAWTNEGDKSVIIQSGTASATYTVATTADSIDEADGAVRVTVNADPAYTLDGPVTDTVTVTDDDATAVRVTVLDTRADISADEGDTNDTAVIALTLRNRGLVTGEELTVPLQFSGGTLGTDFTLALWGSPEGVTLDANTGEVTFTGGDPASARTAPVLLTASDDDDAVSESVTVTIPASDTGSAPKLTATGLGGGVTGIGSGEIALADDDEAALVFAQAADPLEVSEGGSAAYTVALATQPTGTVTVTLTQPTNTDVTVDTDTITIGNQTTLSFTTANWNAPQTVTVAAAQDVDAAGDSADIIHSASGGGYGSVTGTVSVTVADDDADGVTVTETGSGTTVSEDGTVKDSYEVVLTSEPTQDVTIAVTSDDTDVATVDSNTLTFTPGNWNQPQTVTVTGVDDDVVQNAGRTVSISHVATSDDTAYGGIEVASVSVTVSDDDEAGVIITETDGGTVVRRRSSTVREDTYQVVLNSQPTHDVMIAVTSGNTNGATVKKSGGSEVRSLTLTFTPETWNTAQTVTVIGYGNHGAGPVSISHVATSDDTAYNGIEVDPVSVAVANVIRTPSDLTAFEEGTSGTYELVLNLQPSADVTIAFEGRFFTGEHYTNVITFSPEALTFTADDWDTAQEVTITAVDNDVVDSSIVGAIVYEVTSSDGAYDGISYSFGVTVSDDDMAGVTVTEMEDGTTVSEDGAVTDSYQVVLTSEPTQDVTIAVTSDDTDAATVDSDTLTFTPSNWNQPQSVTVTGVDDDIDQSTDRTVSISHVATSEDTAYGGIEVASVSVTVTDDDEAAVGFVEAASTVPERAGTHEVTLRFDVVSAAPLELRYSLSGTATAGRDFTAGDGVLRVPAQAREVTLPVTILDDGEQEADETVVVTLIEDRGGQYRLGSTTTHTLTITDDDSDLAERVVRPALARFGRTVGEQVLDAVTDRLGAARTPGFEGRFAGEALPGMICDDGKSAPDHVLEDDDRRRKCVGQGRYEPGSGRPADPSVAAWSNGLTGGPGGTPEVQAKETSDILPGTSFALTSETENGAALAFWGRGAQSGFSGRAGDLGLEGEVTSFMLGADQARGDWLFGLMLSRSRGEIDYTLGEASGEMETDLTALVPYMGWDVSDRLSVWGAAGLGSGDMRLRPEDGSEFRTDIDWGMAAAGADGALGSVAALGGAELRWLADALWTRTTSDAVPGLEATSGSTTRLRLGLESRWEHSFASAATLSPRLETGLRYDGGDAETGFGLEVGGGVEFTDPSRGLSLGLRGRTLALHQDGNFEDWGLALDLAYDPTPETKRGFAARLSHTFGGASSGGVDALLGPRLFPEASPTGGGDRSWSVEAAYGVSRGRGRVGSPYTTITAAGSGSATGARLGYRIEPDADHAADVNLDFWTEPPTAANDRASGGATLQWKW